MGQNHDAIAVLKACCCAGFAVHNFNALLARYAVKHS